MSPSHVASLRGLFAAAALVCMAAASQAAPMTVNVTVENLAAPNGLAFAPLHVGFGSGSFDAFDIGGVAGAPIVSVAEGGTGSAWFPAFAAADPGAVLGSVLPDPPGPLLPGASATASFVVDPAQNRYFSFAAMVVPSNDFFIGNDSPLAYQLFDAAGHLQITSIVQRARDVWDAGDEVFDPAAAAFVGDNDLRTAQNSVVALNFAELAGFNGLVTGAGYVFNSGLAADDAIYRISFSVAAVPEPGTYALMLGGLMALAFVARRRGASASM
jgi:hypothetical protein